MIMDKEISAYEWGVRWATKLKSLDDLGYALSVHMHGRRILPRQRAAFERGFRDALPPPLEDYGHEHS